MTQPTFVPISEADQVRPARHLHVPGPWTASRPAEIRVPSRLRGPSMGTPGPDAGFALRLAKRFEHDVVLGPGETEHDVTFGVALIAARRAALFGRAPCIYDVQHALALWSFLEAIPAAEQEVRRAAFSSVSHDYTPQRTLADAVDEDTLRRGPEEVRGAAFRPSA
ncbi:MAG TPA: hypothetical protein VL961_06600 [Acidimicrobiales bacterium]|nr:hypothetical protein [Acidimicrobiales bacterium]